MTDERERYLLIKESELESLVAALVKKTLAEMQGWEITEQLLNNTLKERWIRTIDAEVVLGLKKGELTRKLKANWFQEGVHYKIHIEDPCLTPTSAQYRWNIEKCRELINSRRTDNPEANRRRVRELLLKHSEKYEQQPQDDEGESGHAEAD